MGGNAQVEKVLTRSTNGIIEMVLRDYMGSGDWEEESRRPQSRWSDFIKREARIGRREGADSFPGLAPTARSSRALPAEQETVALTGILVDSFFIYFFLSFVPSFLLCFFLYFLSSIIIDPI